MHPKFLKETAKNIAEPLTKIFQKSIETRKIPNTWKLANVTPLHNKGPKQQVTNYRPISLTSIICKSMEKFVKDSLMNHMDSIFRVVVIEMFCPILHNFYKLSYT
jgi:hypothetical protein